MGKHRGKAVAAEAIAFGDHEDPVRIALDP
jgi:hypothetical protein